MKRTGRGKSALQQPRAPSGTRRPWFVLTGVLASLLVGAGLFRHLVLNQHQSPGGPYQLTDAQGHTVTQDKFQGHYTLIYFGYTHCIDVCPLTLATVSDALKDMGALGDRVVPMFITVDPKRDTPTVVGDYVGHFSDRIVGLTGDAGQIKTVLDEFDVSAHMAHNAHHMGPGDYLMDHSSVLYLMDGRNRLVSLLPVDTSAHEVATRLRTLMALG